MIVCTLAECEQSNRKIKTDTWDSTRMLLKDDKMGFSFHITTLYAGGENHFHYKNHYESVYVVSGEGTIEDKATGEVHDLRPGVMYVLDKHDRHIVRPKTEMSVACVFNNLGSLYYAAGFPDQAREMFEDGLKIRTEVLGPTHRDVAQSLCNLGTACHELGDNAAAQKHFEESLGILESQLPTEAASFEAVGLDYLAMLEEIGEGTKAAAFKKRLDKALTFA